jgi:cystathionine gamma-lyase
MHSATKYLGGHSDVLGGALVVRDPDLYQRLYFIQNATGATLSAFDSFLVSRGLKTLALRVLEQSRTAARLAEFLGGDPRVRRVRYPGLADHPGHATAAPRWTARSGPC